MIVFVDESGDAGLKVQQGSSPFFVVALVVFQEEEEADKASQRIDLLRGELSLHPRFEFKFNKLNLSRRKSFLQAVAPYDFFYFGIAVKKEKLWGEGFKFKETFYKYATRLVFQNAQPYLERATVVIDGSGSKDFRLQLQSYLKRHINSQGAARIARVRVQDSANDNLIQLADMIAGSIYRGLTGKADAGEYKKMVAHREIFTQIWPK